MKILFLSLFFLTFTLIGFSQPHLSKVKMINGVGYYEHEVKAGETLYSIIKIYRSEERIVKASNDNLTDAIKIGQIIYIPISINAEKDHIHVVKRKETLYGIAKQYDVSVEQIIQANPTVEEGIKVGQELRLPGVRSSGPSPVEKTEPTYEENHVEDIKIHKETPNLPFKKQDSTFLHVVQPQETLYAISKRFMVDQNTIKEYNAGLKNGLRAGDTIVIPKLHIDEREILIKDPSLHVSVIHPDSVALPLMETKETYNIVFLLPLYLDNAQNSLTSYYNNHSLFKRTQWAIDFYMGALLAIDSLKKTKGNIIVHTFDTQGDTIKLKEILKKEELSQSDMIIGPFYGSEVSIATIWANKNQKFMVLPFPSSNKILLDNPFIIKYSPSKGKMIEASADYLLHNYRQANFYLINSGVAKDKYNYERFKSRFEEKKMDYKEAHQLKINELSLGSASARDLGNSLPGGEINVIIAPSNEITFVTNLLTRLNKVSNERKHQDSKFIVLGQESWLNFHQIDFSYKNRLNVHFPSGSYLNYDLPQTIALTKSFRNKYNTDPTEFAVQGFDVTFYTLGAMKLLGAGFVYENNRLEIPTIKNTFELEQVADGCGFENQYVYILKYDHFEIVDTKNRIPLHVEKE